MARYKIQMFMERSKIWCDWQNSPEFELTMHQLDWLTNCFAKNCRLVEMTSARTIGAKLEGCADINKIMFLCAPWDGCTKPEDGGFQTEDGLFWKNGAQVRVMGDLGKGYYSIDFTGRGGAVHYSIPKGWLVEKWPPPLTVDRIKPGMLFEWERGKAKAWAIVEVTNVEIIPGEEPRIWTRVTEGHGKGREVWNDLSRFREAATGPMS